MTNSENNIFGQWLKQARKAQGITQENLAMKVGCAFETIRKIEAGSRRPSQQMAELIGRTLNVPEHDMPALIERARGYHGNGSLPTFPPLREHTAKVETPGQSFDLPWPLNNEFVGREQEVDDVCKMLMQNEVRLLTMVGAGGIGKTRLAVEVARRCKAQFKSGAFIVLLAPVSSPQQFMSAVMLGLGLQGKSGPGEVVDPERAVYNFLSNRPALILLDNMEHMLSCAPQVKALLSNFPLLKILVTSREPLHLSGEKQYPVPPLSNAPLEVHAEGVGDDGASRQDEKSPEEKSDTASYYNKYEAVQLFVKRAQDIDPRFELTNDNAYYVARICVELDGLPLAIELAASQSKLLTPKALHKRLAKQMRLSMQGATDLPPRQRTLRGAIDWSYSLLKDAERKIFRRMAVFAVGRSLDAIEAICILPSEQGIDVYQVVSSLIDKSLIGREVDADGEPRVFMLRTTKDYAMQCLEESNETGEIQRRHANYFVTLAENAAPELTSPRRNKWLSRLDAELFNMRAAMEWAVVPDVPDAETASGSVEANKRAEIGLRIAGALHWYWYMRGRITEGREWLEKTLAATRVVPGDNISITARARALATSGRMALVQGGVEGIVEILAESVKLWRLVDNKRGLAYALCDLGAASANIHREKDKIGVNCLDEAISLFKQLDDKWGHAYALDLMGDLAILLGKGDEEAARMKQQSLILYKDMDDKWGIATLLTELGYNFVRRSDYNSGKKMLEEAVEMSKMVGDKRYMAFATAALAEVTWYMGDPIKARKQYSESLVLYRELGDRRGEANTLRNLGHLAHREGDERHASSLYYQSLRIERELGSEPNKALLLGALAGLVGALGKPRQAARLLGTSDNALKLTGGRMPPIDRIQRKYTYETLRSLLGDARLEEEMTFGKAIPLEKGLQLINFDLPHTSQ